jgi:hypothetical protein
LNTSKIKKKIPIFYFIYFAFWRNSASNFFLEKKNADSTFPLFKKSTGVSPLVLVPVLIPSSLAAARRVKIVCLLACLFACLRACFAAAPIAVSVVFVFPPQRV